MIAPSGETRPAGAPWLTWLCCALCVVMTAGFHLSGTSREYWGYYPAEAIWDGRYGALITAVFVHGDILHLLFNLLWLVRLGDVVERALGHLEWAVFCLAAAFIASGAELAITSNDAIGASGVVYALFGLTWGARRSVPAFALVATDDNVRFMLGWMVLTFVLTTLGLWNIASAAHAGGLLFGLAVAWLFVEKPLPPRRRALAAALLAGLVILAVLSVTWLPWSPRWQVWRGFRQTAPAAAPLDD
jgi:GlpG protein